MRPLRVLFATALLAGCAAWSPPEPDPVSFRAPAPPQPQAGEIRIYGKGLSEERANALRKRLRAAEPAILDAYLTYLGADPFASGTLQLRIGINRKGEVSDVGHAYSDVTFGSLEDRVVKIVRDIRFSTGTEAYAYYTLAFRPEPFEVLSLQPEFTREPPMLVADVQNRTAFHLTDVAVTVSVLGPGEARPLRISRREMRVPFGPGERRTLRVPVGSEWATGHNSFLVDVRPALGFDEESAERP